MQAIGGVIFIFIVYGIWNMCLDNYKHPKERRVQQVEAAAESSPNEESGQAEFPDVQISVRPRSFRGMDIVLAAARQFQVPPEILLTHWYLESGQSMGGDKGGAGGYNAMSQILSKQSEPGERHRWDRFRENEHDLIRVCAHCGYKCNALQGSSTGALGPMQMMPSTWVKVALDGDGDGKRCPLNLADAMYGAAYMLRRARDRTGSWGKAMLDYAGTDCPRNRAYVRRSIPLLKKYKQVVREYLRKNPRA